MAIPSLFWRWEGFDFSAVSTATMSTNRHQNLSSDADLNEIPADGEVLSGDTRPGLLHRDLVRITGTDADLVFRVAVDGFSQAEVVTKLGLTEAASRMYVALTYSALRFSTRSIPAPRPGCASGSS